MVPSTQLVGQAGQAQRSDRTPPSPGNDWFSSIFDFSERSYEETKSWLKVTEVEEGWYVLESLAEPKRKYDVGRFRCPSLADLRGQAVATPLPGRLVVSNDFGDAAEKHGEEDNRFATFQVASQFNCLEFVGPNVAPEDGITGYVNDRTQGPACSIACGPATAYRNYFAPVDTVTGKQEGQSRGAMIDNLADFSRVVGNIPPGRLFEVRGGYTLASEAQLGELNDVFARLEAENKIDDARAALRIGLHEDVQVTSTAWGTRLVHNADQKVTQVFASACSVGYAHSTQPSSWGKLAPLILEACYESTLLTAQQAAVRHDGKYGSKRVFLTAVGGGVFGNSMEWIVQAMRHAFMKCRDVDLDVRIVTYAGEPHVLLQQLVQEVQGWEQVSLPKQVELPAQEPLCLLVNDGSAAAAGPNITAMQDLANMPIRELGRFFIRPGAVLGANEGDRPGSHVAVVCSIGSSKDYAPASFGNPSARHVHEWLGIMSDKSLPDDVIDTVRRGPGSAKLHTYPGEKTCIHVWSPNLAASPNRADAVEALSCAYQSVLSQFTASGLGCLRLSPISGGGSSGGYDNIKDMPVMTEQALSKAFSLLAPDVQRPLSDKSIEMCIFVEDELVHYQKAIREGQAPSR